jgi:glycosyltransferase involved in cell wall biosynthesis
VSAPPRPCFSVVIPTRDAAAVIVDCLAALARQSIASTGEVIVVDDGSTDDTVKVARSLDVPGLLVLENPPRGKSAARNAGLAAARGQIVLFTDADCVPDHDWAERMLAAFGDASVAGARGVYRTRQPELVARFVQAEFEEKYRCLARSQARSGGIEFADTYATGYRREILTGLGGFDELFVGAEDAELSFRVVANGYRLVYVADGIVYHRHPATARDYLKRKASYAFWRAQVFRRYPDRMARDSYTPRSIPIQMALSLLFVAALALTPIAGGISGRRGVNLFGGAAGLALAGFLTATLPFAARYVRRDPGLALAIPGLTFARAVVQGIALAYGLSRWARRRLGPASLDQRI